MEQRIDDRFLRPTAMTKACAVAVVSIGVGCGILLAAWSASFLFRPNVTIPEVRIANPEVRIAPDSRVRISDDSSVNLSSSSKAGAAQATNPLITLPEPSGGSPGKDDAVLREATIFSTVKHVSGVVVTGWKYASSADQAPHTQYCYFSSRKDDGSRFIVDLAVGRSNPLNANAFLLPGFEEALAKCQWWQK
jgi:hypothetical protein